MLDNYFENQIVGGWFILLLLLAEAIWVFRIYRWPYIVNIGDLEIFGSFGFRDFAAYFFHNWYPLHILLLPQGIPKQVHNFRSPLS